MQEKYVALWGTIHHSSLYDYNNVSANCQPFIGLISGSLVVIFQAKIISTQL